ncbi:hypothetical protein G7Y79_00031g066490 [Physcia stellaris]|nr:hypothetical protein G7Y79_00031g066490 [Physcia stellaris]
MSSFVDRCASFVNYPPSQYPPPSQLLSANFTSKQNPDIPGQVYCDACGIKFYGFKPTENPYQKHCDNSPTCPWVIAERAPKAMPTPPSTPKAVAAMPTPPATPPPASEPALMLTPPVSHPKPTSKPSLPDTPPATPKQSPTEPTATPRKPISWAEIASRPVIASKPSRLPVPTPKKPCKALETAAVVCPPTPPPTPPQKPVPIHQHQKPYLTIQDLFEMFAEKRTESGLQHTKKTESSPKVSRQSKITSYFRPTTNQSITISQGSKTPNPRSFQQHTPAESNRAKSIPPTKWSEKSAILPYKSPTFSRLIPQRYQAFRHIKCQVSHTFGQWLHLANPLPAYPVHPPSRMPAASAAVLSDPTMACIGTYEQSISTMHLAMGLRSIERPGAIPWPEILDLLMEIQAISLLLFMYY